ncbi:MULTISPECIES: DUF3169 family protein [Bacillus]|nr:MULTISPECIES: DUF3169 family protein [Bacillus]MDG1621789.1 DUF3169 family protein [Bacillus mobilis]MDX5836802.1 DUF3169 family protein [Bacillus cereus group sp. BfR-BA-01700]MED4384207.1 DUF3169 family protein [Bacillus mobilis]NEK98446.1 DUF3169 family protein [Bacillus mobilis]OJE34473.1 DUF3169 domain-containing protein [Bacillus mobilis]
MKSKLGEQFFSFCKIILSMIGGFFASYIALDMLSDEPRKLSPNILIGVCTIFGMIMMYYTWKNTRMLAEARDEEESVQGRKLGIISIYLRVGDIVTQAWFVYAVITCRRALSQDTNVSFAVWNLAASIICLTTVVIIGIITKNRYNKLYPEQGVTYIESMEMWKKNADEGLKHIVHEAGYKAYEFTNKVLAYVWWAAVIYTAVSDIDFVLIGLISLIWILHLGKFMYEMHRKMIY